MGLSPRLRRNPDARDALNLRVAARLDGIGVFLFYRLAGAGLIFPSRLCYTLKQKKGERARCPFPFFFWHLNK